MVTQEELKVRLQYNPETGLFHWLHSGKGRKLHKPIGCLNTSGYLYTQLKTATWKGNLLLHRLAFLYMKGTIPEYVDHINRLRTDNRWLNLRACTSSENALNKKLGINKSGFPGIYPQKKHWVVTFTYQKTKYVKSFPTLSEAILWRDSTRLKIGAPPYG